MCISQCPFLNIMHFIELNCILLWVYFKNNSNKCYEQIHLMHHYLYLFGGPVIHILISTFVCSVLVLKLHILRSFSILLNLGSSKWESFCEKHKWNNPYPFFSHFHSISAQPLSFTAFHLFAILVSLHWC